MKPDTNTTPIKSKMYRNILSITALFLLFMLSVASTSGFTYAQDWIYSGTARTGDGDSFYIFLNYSSNSSHNGSLRFYERHSFISTQTLPSGKKYLSVELSRKVDCNNRKIADTAAVFKDGNGDIVEKYSSSGEEQYVTVSFGNNVNYKVFRIICNK